ncbi:MAG: DUF4416 family protein [Candidatus Marinimicrobia bacterium]|nr:DUF4416 family protein [Candidatus Neomarinimicrobiota bacterium]MCF7921449.1 DUF4416 family protein [Candidatus Neomarinimicrobiota bacterium]
MKTVEPQKVKYFIGALFSNADVLEKALGLCQAEIGNIDFHSENFPFELTHYYDEEMGGPIFRSFFSFETLRSPGDLAKLKVLCNRIEDQLSIEGNRKVNLDMGYLDFHKVILASAKYNGQKIYLDQGIYADPTLFFESGQFHAFENTFPDFKSNTYDEVFLEIRNIYKNQLKSGVV